MKERFFTYEGLGGDFTRLNENIRHGVPTSVYGLFDSDKYLVAALSDAPFVYITPSAVDAALAHSAISTLSGKRTVLLTSKDDLLTYRVSASRDALYQRVAAVDEILGGNFRVVCDIESVAQLIPKTLEHVDLVAGEEFDFASLPARLARMGYMREYEVDAAGTYTLRGDILDIFPVGGDNPVRVDFFGDTVEKIRPYDLATGERLPDTPRLHVAPAADAFIGSGESDVIRAALEREVASFSGTASYARAREIQDDVERNVSAGNATFPGASFVFPIIENSGSLFDVMPKDTVIYFDECKAIEDRFNALFSEHTERYSELHAGGESFSFSFDQMISPDAFVEKVRPFVCVSLQQFIYDARFFKSLQTISLRSTPTPVYNNSLEMFVSDARNWLSSGYRVIVFTDGPSRAEKLFDLLCDEYIPVDYVHEDVSSLRAGVSVCTESLRHGTVLHDSKLAIVGSGDIYTKISVERHIRRRKGDLFVAPEVGDYAVHEKHGIGIVKGTRKITTGDGTKEYIALEYRNGDMLYVPVEQMDTLSKYTGNPSPELSALGGRDFEKTKERVRKSLKTLAIDLKKLYAERSQSKGFRFPENAVMMNEFEDQFPYEETPDQLESIADVKRDMCSDKVMDRLLCGDVGYGKTEVALRAVYLCVLGGKQAALLCPSTVLSEQHFNVARKRFEEFGVRVEKLNRFCTPAEQKATIGRLANGEVDFVIGTHRLLSKDVRFHDLGLLVLDEEQRFGVEHKETIKRMKTNVDCLTMSATPIPRTLHMSLSGIRDISTINTPPLKRLPVQTCVIEESEVLIRDACMRELSRGGQVFIVYNRVETIAEFTRKIERIVPEGNVCYADGRMEKDRLERNVESFYDGKTNILVTTTIIENGVDLPNANTIIIIDADRMGTSQLYQLRGRVGRSTRLAYAYLTFKPGKVLTESASERLKAIMQFTELGSGFKVAMRDLEIRGAGDVLGARQSGHMEAVGYELYNKLLKEELTGEPSFTAELDIRTSAFIPETYIESNAGRMDCYKQIAEIRSVDDYKRIAGSIVDNYGKMPQEVLNLLIVAVLKSYAMKFNIKKIIVTGDEGRLVLPSISAMKDGRIYETMKKYPGRVSLSMSGDPAICFTPSSTPEKTMLQMTKFLRSAASFT